MDCTLPASTSNKQMSAYRKQARWAIFSEDFHTAWIYHTRSHGEHFTLYHNVLPVPGFLKKEILSQDGLETSAGGLITASSARRQLEAGAISGLPAAIPKELLSSVAKIQDIIAYRKRKQRGQQGEQLLICQERLQQVLSRAQQSYFCKFGKQLTKATSVSQTTQQQAQSHNWQKESPSSNRRQGSQKEQQGKTTHQQQSCV